MRLIFIFALFTSPAFARGLHERLTRGIPARVLAIGGSLAGQAAQVIATRQALAQPNTREANPFLQNKNAALGISIAAAVATITASEILQRTHHHKLAIAVPAILGAEAWAVSGWNWSAARSGVGPM